MEIKSERRKPFIYVMIYILIIVFLIVVINLKDKPSFAEFSGAALISVILLANVIFFFSNSSDIIIKEDFLIIKFPILKKEAKIKYDDILGYDNKNSSVYFFKTLDNKVFAIRKFEFNNYLDLTTNISSKTKFLKINVFSNAVKGSYSYLLATIIVAILFLISRLL